MRALILALALVSTPAAAAEQQQFDLICTAKKETTRYRVDLARGEWCAGDCPTTSKIAETSSSILRLVDHERGFPSDTLELTQIDRVTGEWVHIFSTVGPATNINIKGKCDAAPFSGMPAAKF